MNPANRLVVDTSVAAKWFDTEGEAYRDEATSLLHSALAQALEIHAPTLLVFELGNFFVKRARGKGSDPRLESLDALFTIPIIWHDFDLPLSHRAMALAVGHGLTFYDASFAALAEHIEGLLVTADATLARPFPRSRVRLLGRDPVPS